VIVDTHVHVIASDTTRYPLRPRGHGHDEWFRLHGVTVDEYRAQMDGAGVDHAVLVQALSAYTTDNSYVLDAACSDPERFRSVVIVDDGDQLSESIAVAAVRGVRVIGADPAVDPIVATAAMLGLPVVVALFSGTLDDLPRLLDEFPAVPFALDHCGFASTIDPTLLDLVEYPNLFLKVTSIVLEREPNAFEALIPVFDSERLMWGSDWSQTHDRSYEALVDLAHTACKHLDPVDRDQVLAHTAHRLFF
jgi:predicted TIM-barrel fold metal-dependent hydrolase